jgi:hypothetical protein
MLTAHADILIGRELPLERLPSLRPLLEETAEYQGKQWTDERRAEAVRSLWFSISRPSWKKPNTRRWGMKTPWAEFDKDLWNPLVNPVYVYALRRGDRVFQSHIRLGWGIVRSPERLVSKYKESLRTFEELRAAGSAHMVQLDLAQDTRSRHGLAKDLFAFLDEELDAGVKLFVDKWPMHWSKPTSAPNKEPELPDQWQELLACDSEYQDLMTAYGYQQ